MMDCTKKLLCLLLALCLSLQLLCIPAYAIQQETASAEPVEEAQITQPAEESGADGATVTEIPSEESSSEDIPFDTPEETALQVEERLFMPLLEEQKAVNKYMYLSELSPLSYTVGWGSLQTDVNVEGGQLSLIVDGQRKYFYKGVAAHAGATLIYDLGADHGYEFFDAYMGIDASKGGQGNVKFSVYISADNEVWEARQEPTVLTSASEAIHLNFSLVDVRYLKFVFDSNGVNSYDHSCLCGAVMYTGTVSTEIGDLPIETVASLTSLIAGRDYGDILTAPDLRMVTLRRSLVEKVGYDTLVHSFFDSSKREERIAMMQWLWNDERALTEFMTGGTPNGGSYLKSLMVLSDLYAAHKDDLSDETALYTTPDGDMTNDRGRVYRTMMLSIALTHDNGPYMWLASQFSSDPLERYAAFKRVYTEGLMRNDVWENLSVEEMRYVMSNRIWNDEIYWINRYIRSTSSGNNLNFPNMYSPHRYLKYGKDWNNREKGLYDSDNYKNNYDSKYSLTLWGVDPPVNDNKLWMVFEGSHICWGISYVGTNFAGSFGVPSHYVRQPGHAAFFVYNRNSSGRTTWGIDNNISGWTQTWLQEDTVGNGNNRMMCDWGTRSQSWVTGNNATYIMMAATALDDLRNYEKTETLMSLLSTCTTAGEKEALYRAVLAIMPYHLDAWKGLVDLYTSTKTAADCAGLAAELQAQMWYFPLPMHDLMTLLYSAVQKGGDTNKATWMAAISNLEVQGLKKGSAANSSAPAKSLLAQTDVCVVEANYLQGEVSTELASFSFDGGTPGALLFGSSYSGVRFRYSLDGGASWSEMHTTDAYHMTYTFSQQELSSITAENDILIWLEGWVSDQPDNAPTVEGAYRIDITAGSAVSGMECNDRENRFLGTVAGKEYSYDGSTWHEMTAETTFEGEKTVRVRNRASGCKLAGPVSEYQFAENSTPQYSYIPIRRLTLDGYSSQETSRAQDQAAHVIDGLLSTRWHTLWSGGDSARYVTVKLDRPTYVSGVDYTPIADAGNGTFYGCDVYVSADGISWALAAGVTGWAKDNTVKKIRFENPVYGQYVRVCGTSTVGGYGSARELSFYEDTTFAGKIMTGFTITAPAKTTYCVGEPLDLTDMTVTFHYTDSSTVTMPASLLTASETVFYTQGQHTVYMHYGSFEAKTFSVNVQARSFTPTTLQVVREPDCMIYLAGDTFDPSGMELTISDGTTTAYLQAGEYTWEADFSEAGEKTVTISYGDLHTTLPVTVKKGVSGIAITRMPRKLTYTLGESFDPAGMEVTITYADSSTELLSDLEYTFPNVENFSDEDGTVPVTVALCDRLSITDVLEVTVYPYLTRNGISYELSRNDAGMRVCYVTGIQSQESYVEIPAQVEVGARAYPVVGIESGAMDASSGVRAVALPGSIEEIASGAFTGCAGIEKIFLTQHSSFDDLHVAADAFSSDTELVFYAADEERTEELAGKDFMQNLAVENVAGLMTGITVAAPVKTEYSCGDTLDTTGLTVYAVLADDIRVPLTDAAYTLEPADMNTAGDRNVYITVTVYVSGVMDTYTGHFEIHISPAVLHITKNPVSAIYYTISAEVVPLYVTATSSQPENTFTYQWYRSTSGKPDDVQDLIVGATESTYTPDRIGYYYVKVSAPGSESVTSMMAYVDIGDYSARIGTKGYTTLSSAVIAAGATDVVSLTRDITLTDSIAISRTVALDGEGYTIHRGADFTGTFFHLSGSGKLTARDIVLDGGAIWTGTINETLQRGTVNSGLTARAPLIHLENSSLVTLQGGTVLQNNCNTATVTSNTAGGIFACNTSGIILEGAAIENCYSYLFGSAIYHRDSTALVIRDAFIHGNSGSTQYNTTAICVDNSSTASVYGGTFCHNLGAEKGGVFWVSNGRLDLFGGTYEENSASIGALVYLSGSAGLNIGACDALQEVYLPAGKYVTVTADLGSATLPVSSGSGAGTVVVKAASNDLLTEAVANVLIDGVAGIYSEGGLQKAGGISGSVTAIITRDQQNLTFDTLSEALGEVQAGEIITLWKDAALPANAMVGASVYIRTAGHVLHGITAENGYLGGTVTRNGVEMLAVVHYGDLNGDGAGLLSSDRTLCALDLEALYGYLSAESRPALYQDAEMLSLFRAAADVNCDGAVNILDYQRYYACMLHN